MPPAKDLKGQTFGRLTALAPTSVRIDGKVVWLCECSCGQYTTVMSKHLISGATKSCGCIIRDGVLRQKDLTGKVFHRLTVTHRGGFKGQKVSWFCVCTCGTVCEVQGAHLTSGATKSCGCLQKERHREACRTHGLTGKPEYYRAATALRRATKRKQTPPWADKTELRDFYKVVRKDIDIDHDIPLTHHKVCGLHTVDNLRYLPSKTNRQKSNKFAPYREIKATGERVMLEKPQATRAPVKINGTK